MTETFPSMQHEFTYEGRAFRAVAKRCGHDGCVGLHAYIDEVDDAGERLEGGFSRKTFFPIPDEDFETEDSFVLGLLSALPVRWRESVVAYEHEVDEEHFQSVRFAKDDVRNGYLQPYIDIVDPECSILSGGGAVDYEFRFKGRTFLVVEMYCPAPDCDCGVGTLAFLEQTVLGDPEELGDEAEIDIEDVFRVDLNFAGEHQELVGDEPEKEAIFAEFMRLFADELGHIAERYAAVRAVGLRSIAPRSFKRPASKNAPCPCGSGKKYKGCCGRG